MAGQTSRRVGLVSNLSRYGGADQPVPLSGDLDPQFQLRWPLAAAGNYPCLRKGCGYFLNSMLLYAYHCDGAFSGGNAEVLVGGGIPTGLMRRGEAVISAVAQ